MAGWQVVRPGPVGTGPLRAARLPVPQPAPGELLVRVLACGVCRTDLHVTEGDRPVHRPAVVPGHEVVGEVAALGAGANRVPPAGAAASDGWRVGDRVGVAWLRYTDGSRRYCRRGAENLCPASTYTGWAADGAAVLTPPGPP
jgi:propanol-preferring alcohol dehydrogenase